MKLFGAKKISESELPLRSDGKKRFGRIFASRRAQIISLFLLFFLVLLPPGLYFFIEAFLLEPSRLVLVKQTVKIPSLAPEHEGFKIVLISDTHASKNKKDQDLLRRAVDLANEQDADMILLLGDYLARRTESHAMPMKEFFPLLKTLKAKYGVYAVLGNHDIWINAEKITHHLTQNGIPVLSNRALTFDVNGRKLHLAGLAELKPDVGLRFVKREKGETLIVMAHHPELYPHIYPKVSLIVAGHTHGGQVKLPLLGIPYLPSVDGRRFTYGLIEEKPGKPMFVTSGVGTSILRVRLNCPPEIVLLTLEK